MTVQAHRKEPRATVEMDPNERQVRAGRLLPLGPSSSLRRPPSNIVRALKRALGAAQGCIKLGGPRTVLVRGPNPSLMLPCSAQPGRVGRG